MNAQGSWQAALKGYLPGCSEAKLGEALPATKRGPNDIGAETARLLRRGDRRPPKNHQRRKSLRGSSRADKGKGRQQLAPFQSKYDMDFHVIVGGCNCKV